MYSTANAADGRIAAWLDGALVPMDKLEVHRQGLRHPAVSVFILDGSRTLIQRRALSKYHTPGLWANSCCTHPHWGESPEACATRRLWDELGITGLSLEPRGEIRYRADVGGGMTEDEEVNVFVASGRPQVQRNPDEVMATQWIELEDLRDWLRRMPEDFTPWLRIYMADHADRIFGA